MILPSKDILPERALLTVGAEVLEVLTESKTVGRLWTDLKALRTRRWGAPLLTWEWFVLSLDLLFTIDAVHWDGHRVRRVER